MPCGELASVCARGFFYAHRKVGRMLDLMRRTWRWFYQMALASRRGIRDTILSMIPQAVTVGAGAVSAILIARGLGPKGLGQYALVTSLSSLITSLSDLGIGNTAIRYSAQAAATGDRTRHLAILRWALRRRLLSTVCIALGVFSLAPWVATAFWKDPSLVPIIRIALGIGVMGAISAVPTVYFQSLQRFAPNSLVSVGQTLIALAGIAGIALLGLWSVRAVILASLLATSLGAIVFLNLLPREALFSKADVAEAKARGLWQALWRSPAGTEGAADAAGDTSPEQFAALMSGLALLGIITGRVDVWLMGNLLPQEQVGYYASAQRVAVPLYIVLNGINTALWPRVSAISAPRELIPLLKKTMQLSALVIAGGIFYTLLSPFLATFLFGAAYTASAPIARLLCLRVLLSLLFLPMHTIGYGFGLVRAYLPLNLMRLGLVLGLNLLFLGRFGPMAAGWALIASDLTGLVATAALIGRRIRAMRLVEGEESQHKMRK